jgi:signal transduction histidine kinase
MKKLKYYFIELLSMATHVGMEENKKLAIQVATFDGFWSCFAVIFYLCYSLYFQQFPLYLFHSIALISVAVGLCLLRLQRYDIARYLIHLTGLAEVFLSADALGPTSGFEFYYFTSITIPYVTFSIEERTKGFVLSGISFVLLVTQLFLGPGIFLAVVPVSEIEKYISVFVMITFIITVMSVSRWQIIATQNELKKQQAEIIHNSNLIALGEMSGGIAHEINNPLQTLSLHFESIRRYLNRSNELPDRVREQLVTIEKTIFKISVMIKGLKELSRDVEHDPLESFHIQDVLDSVLGVSSQRLRSLGISLNIENLNKSKVRAKSVQLSQVLINLLNNSIDALEYNQEKWINVLVVDGSNGVSIVVTDSGPEIPIAIQNKMMRPFFTTKEPGKGTGLGLSISHTIIHKWGGRFYFDPSFGVTRFVIELPFA